ncbi:aminoglycoside phosphotransferase family protein [Saccharopolyspora gloriosae]|nr:aminoglycoside phosphotransferase family protein [Saccharopolyspora gloriosae]
MVATRFPRWGGLPVTPVEVDGWDNRTYRLGERMTVRLPTAPEYEAAIHKEHHWLPLLAPSLPVAIPEPLAKGEPGCGFPRSWSIRRWLDGATAAPGRIADLTSFAVSVAEFLSALHRIDASGGPPPGAHNFHRGAPPAHYDGETRAALAELDGRIDVDAVAAVWDAALDSTWGGDPVWFHGDVAVGNLLVRDGRLSAVIDFGSCGVGDPACDLVIAWTLFTGASRDAFRAAVGLDDATWARARGWALWKALITLAADPLGESAVAQHRVLDAVLAEV